MLHCQKGRDLLLDLKRSDWLPPYDENGIRYVINEINDLFTKLLDRMSTDDLLPEEKITIVFIEECIHRNQRYLLAYLTHRMNRIRNLRFETGAVLPEHISRKLSPRENDFFAVYNSILTDYCTELDIDLTSDLEPPRDLLIEVRALQNCGEIMTENGPVNLDAGSTHFLRRSDVEPLIRQGQVEHIHNDL